MFRGLTLCRDYSISTRPLSFQIHAKQSRPGLFIVLLLWVARLFLRPVLNSEGSLHLLDYVRDLKVGLGHWAVDSMGAAQALTSRGRVRVHVCVWVGG